MAAPVASRGSGPPCARVAVGYRAAAHKNAPRCTADILSQQVGDGRRSIQQRCGRLNLRRHAAYQSEVAFRAIALSRPTPRISCSSSSVARDNSLKVPNRWINARPTSIADWPRKPVRSKMAINSASVSASAPCSASRSRGVHAGQILDADGRVTIGIANFYSGRASLFRFLPKRLKFRLCMGGIRACKCTHSPS